MVLFPNCKINLGLKVLAKRDDGFHDLQTVFYPAPLNDALEIITATREHGHLASSPGVEFHTSGLSIDSNSSDNLCVKAYHLLRTDFELPPVEMHLHKAIPMGAGLGGGSSDGAFTLRLLNEKYNLGLSKAELIQYAVKLGSDCPFFVVNKPCFATSRGEMMEEIPLDLSSYQLILVNPGLHINTGWAFGEISAELSKDSSNPDFLLPEILAQHPTTWKEHLTNDFEKPVFRKFPEISKIKTQLYEQGAVFASMTGTGSTIYGFFENNHLPSKLDFPESYKVFRMPA